MARVIRLTLEYDGAGFCGWQTNPGVRTVQGVLQEAVRRMTREPELKVYGASRTDAGVHAAGQVASFETGTTIPTTGFLRGLNGMLPGDLAVVDCREEIEGFHARHSSVGKRYRYTILNRAVRSPLAAARSWYVRRPLELDAMAEGARHLVGEHDFSAFRATGCSAATPVKELLAVGIRRAPGDMVSIEVVGSAFLKYMVRNIVGTLVDIGRGRFERDWTARLLRTGRRSDAGPTAPPQGLCLVEVFYSRAELEAAAAEVA